MVKTLLKYDISAPFHSFIVDVFVEVILRVLKKSVFLTLHLREQTAGSLSQCLGCEQPGLSWISPAFC